MRAPQTEQHGRRHRKTNQEVLDDYVSARQEVKNAYMYVEVCNCMVMEDMLCRVYALITSVGGEYDCEMCMYEDKRDMQELMLWEAINSETIERWLQLRGCHLMKTVSVGGCKHASMPWQLEERKKRAV